MFSLSSLGSIDDETVSNDIDTENENQLSLVCDTDEELELNDSFNISADGSSSTYEEMDLFDNVKQELAHSCLKISVNNENKYLHYVNKQHTGFYRIACKSLCHDF